MPLRRLTNDGIDAFSNYLAKLREDPTLAPPVQLLDAAGMSEPLATAATVEPRAFPTRLAAAEYLHGILTASGLPGIDRDRGLWTWLTLFYFDQLCPADGNGKRKVRESAAYFPRFNDGRRYHRNLLFGPYAIYRLYHHSPEVLPLLLSGTITEATGLIFRQFVQNVDLIVCRNAIKLSNDMYFDPRSNAPRRGAASACARFVTYLQQINLTYDLQSISEQKLRAMLPKEFHKHAAN